MTVFSMTSPCKCPCSMKSPYLTDNAHVINVNFCKNLIQMQYYSYFFPFRDFSGHILFVHSTPSHEDVFPWPLLSFLFFLPPLPLDLFIHPGSFASIFMSLIDRILCILMRYRIHEWENTQYMFFVLICLILLFPLAHIFMQKNPIHLFFIKDA